MELEQKQYFLKGLLIIQTVGVLVYTAITIQNEGFTFLEKAKDFAISMSWMGQFTVDFQCYLMLSALWIVWRNKYTTKSIVFAIVAMILGIIVFAPYLLYLLLKEKGNLSKVLIGERL